MVFAQKLQKREDTHASDVKRHEMLNVQLSALETHHAQVLDDKALERDNAMRIATKEARVAKLIAEHNVDSATQVESWNMQFKEICRKTWLLSPKVSGCFFLDTLSVSCSY